MSWIQKNFKTIIYISFLVPILTVAFVSISHVTKWYGISNPVSWAVYLSIGIEIAALSALAAISANMGKKVYFPFGMVTLIQFIGNVYFAYQYIDINSESFKDWVGLVDPIVSFLGVESGDLDGHKRFLSFFSGGMLPLISLSFLHMLVKFEEDEKKKMRVESFKESPTQTIENLQDDISLYMKEMPTDNLNPINEEPEFVQGTEKKPEETQQQDEVPPQTEIINEEESVIEDPIKKRKTLTYVKQV